LQKPSNRPEEFYTVVDDETYDELATLAGERIMQLEVWEDSLADALDDQIAAEELESLFDIDLYLAANVYFELYGVQCFTTPDSEPWQGLENVTEQVVNLVKRGLWLIEIAVSEDDGLVLVLGRAQKPELYLVVGGWLLEEQEAA